MDENEASIAATCQTEWAALGAGQSGAALKDIFLSRVGSAAVRRVLLQAARDLAASTGESPPWELIEAVAACDHEQGRVLEEL